MLYGGAAQGLLPNLAVLLQLPASHTLIYKSTGGFLWLTLRGSLLVLRRVG